MSTLQERLRTIASRGRMDDADVQEVFEAADALDAAEAKLAAIDALHQPSRPERNDIARWCQSCGTSWPCPTHRILHPQGGSR